MNLRPSKKSGSLAIMLLGAAAVLFALAGCQQKSAVPAEKAAEFLEKTSEKGPVKLTVRLSPKEPRLSDLLELDVIVQAALEVEVKPPPFGKSVGEFLINDYREKPQKIENGLRTWSFHYRLEPVRTGKHLIRSVAIEFIDKRAEAESKDKPLLLESDPLEVEITSEMGAQVPTLDKLRAMQAPRELPPRPWPAWVWSCIGGGAAILALLLAWMYVRRRQQKEIEVPRTPMEIAADELKALLAENLPGKGAFPEFYVRLTGIVRRFIESTTGLHAPEQTTEEFLHEIRMRPVFAEDRARRLLDFLAAADMVKYAALKPGERQLEEAVARAQEFIGAPSALEPLPVPPAGGVRATATLTSVERG